MFFYFCIDDLAYINRVVKSCKFGKDRLKCRPTLCLIIKSDLSIATIKGCILKDVFQRGLDRGWC